MTAFKTLALLATFCAAASAFAQERVPEPASATAMPAPAASPAWRRADVSAALQQARQEGSVRIYDAEHHVPAPVAAPPQEMRAQAARPGALRRFDGNTATDGRG